MPDPSPQQFEGRLNAHRKLLVALTAFIAGGDEGRAFLERTLRDCETVADHQEDPGMEPDGSFAIQQIADDEMLSIVSASLSRVQAAESAQVARNEEYRGSGVRPESEDQ
jgi:hypothetical protein